MDHQNIEMLDLHAFTDAEIRMLGGDYHITDYTKKFIIDLMWQRLWI